MQDRHRKLKSKNGSTAGCHICAERLRKISELHTDPHLIGLDMVVSRMFESKGIFKILRSHTNGYTNY